MAFYSRQLLRSSVLNTIRSKRKNAVHDLIILSHFHSTLEGQ